MGRILDAVIVVNEQNAAASRILWPGDQNQGGCIKCERGIRGLLPPAPVCVRSRFPISRATACRRLRRHALRGRYKFAYFNTMAFRCTPFYHLENFLDYPVSCL